MKKTILALSLMLSLVFGIGYSPSQAFADGDESLAGAQSPLGTIETAAVTGPIAFGWITYVRCVCGGAAVEWLGTIQTDAVTSPITFGNVTYIP